MSLPSGWVVARLGELAEFIMGQAPPASDCNFHGIGTPFVKAGEFGAERPEIREWTTRPLKLAKKDDVLICVVGATAGKLNRGADCAIGRSVAAIRPNEATSSDFLYPRMRSEITRLRSGSAGTAQGVISREMLGEVEIALPPAAEQRRIVAKLDALMARLARARAELDRLPLLAENLRIEALRSSFHWRADDLPSGWSFRRIDEIGDVQLGRQRSPKDHTGPNMRPYLRAANITWSGWELTDVKEMNFSPDEFKTFALRRGDVLLNEGSGSAKEVGKPAVWKGEIDDICFQNTLLRIRTQAYDSDLLRYCLLYLAKSGRFIANTQGVNIIHIGKAGLARMMIPVPPSDEQGALLKQIDAVFAHADRLEAEAVRARALLDRLESAILAKAFRGELVPQDPNDEPASVLLDRIRAQREPIEKPKRRRASASSQPKSINDLPSAGLAE